MTSKWRTQRGRETQEAVAGFLRQTIFPYAISGGSGQPGKDILNTDDLSIEVKARRDLNLTAWLRQADKYDGLSCVVHRPDGMGPESVGLWPMTFRFRDGVELLRDADYGETCW